MSVVFVGGRSKGPQLEYDLINQCGDEFGWVSWKGVGGRCRNRGPGKVGLDKVGFVFVYIVDKR